MREALEGCEEGRLRLRWLQKLTAHLFNLDGLVELRRSESDPPSEERLAGGKVGYWAQEVGRCLTLAFPNGEAKPLMNAIALSWLLNSPPQRLFDEWKKGRPILLQVGYQRHSAILLVWRGQYLLCNRGGASRAPIELFQFSHKRLTLPIFLSQFQQISQERALSRLKEATETGPFLPNASLIAEATEQLNLSAKPKVE